MNPRLIFLDGPSAAGKTTLAFALSAASDIVEFIPRMTTRPVRVGLDESEYIFVTQSEFDSLKDESRFVEYREYEFGMSYGLPKDAIDATLGDGRRCPLAIVNLGRAGLVREAYPSAIGVYVTVPIETLRARLSARGAHSDEQIEERIANASSIDFNLTLYDFIANNDGPVQPTVDKILDLVRSRT